MTTFTRVYQDALQRLNQLTLVVALVIGLILPSTTAAEDGDANLDNNFVAQQSNDSTVLSDVRSMTGLFKFSEWRHRGSAIRSGATREQCYGNLSLALGQVGPLYSAETSGSSGALSLLPTAGALIGAATQELWLLFKLVPVAGVFSMALSLGGSIIPTQSSEYQIRSDSLHYGGMVGVNSYVRKRLNSSTIPESADKENFANKVQQRVMDVRGNRKRKVIVFVGVLFQLFWIAVLLTACYITQTGSVVAWWCQAWGWMYLWYLMVVFSTFFENIAGVPFSKQWTLRVSKAPRMRISDDAPDVTAKSGVAFHEQALTTKNLNGMQFESVPMTEILPRHKPLPSATHTNADSVPASESLDNQGSDILRNLKSGYNTVGKIALEETWTASTVPIYVIISVDEVTAKHAMLKVIAKALSVGTFAAGTATFASATLITISVALTVLCMVLGAGVFGRVVALWMAAELMQGDPIIHKVVKDEDEAASYIESIVTKEDLLIEVSGHVIARGRCISRYNRFLQWSNLLGILAPPFDLEKIAASTGPSRISSF